MNNTTAQWVKDNNLVIPPGFFSQPDKITITGDLRIGCYTNMDKATKSLILPIKSGVWDASSYNAISTEDFWWNMDELAAEGKKWEGVDPVIDAVDKLNAICLPGTDDLDIITTRAATLIELGFKHTEVAIKTIWHWAHLTDAKKQEYCSALIDNGVLETKCSRFYKSIENLKNEEWITKCHFFSMVHADYVDDPRFSQEKVNKTILKAPIGGRVETGYYLTLVNQKSLGGLSKETIHALKTAAINVADKAHDIARQNQHRFVPKSLRHVPNSGPFLHNHGFAVACPWSDGGYAIRTIRNESDEVIFVGCILLK